MKPRPMIAIALIVLGIAAFAYQGITYTTRERVAEIGSLHVTKEKTNRIPLPPKRMHLDLLLKDSSHHIAVELKYKTKKVHLALSEEEFRLRDQSAQDVCRYDFLKDIFGHIHDGYGFLQKGNTTYLNASVCDENYKPLNPVLVVEIDNKGIPKVHAAPPGQKAQRRARIANQDPDHQT